MSLTGRESTYTNPQFLPDIGNTVFEGHSVDIGFIVLDQFDPPPPPECITVARHILCFAAVPPCDPQSGLPMLICNESCEAYKRLLSVDFCQVLDDHIRTIQKASTVRAIRVLPDRYFEFECDDSSTYIFNPMITEFSCDTCLQVFEPNIQGMSNMMSLL